MKKIIIASIALLAAGALPAAAQTVNWNGSFGGASGAGSAVTGGFAFGAGSTAAGQAATTGWAEGKGTVLGIGGGMGSKMGHYGGSGGIGVTLHPAQAASRQLRPNPEPGFSVAVPQVLPLARHPEDHLAASAFVADWS